MGFKFKQMIVIITIQENVIALKMSKNRFFNVSFVQNAMKYELRRKGFRLFEKLECFVRGIRQKIYLTSSINPLP
jgi:hypothetical protein